MENELNNIVIDYLSDPDNTAKALALQQWLAAGEDHPQLFNDIKQIWEATRHLPPAGFDRATGWDSLATQLSIPTATTTTKVFSIPKKWWWAAAVMLPLLIFTGYRYFKVPAKTWTNYLAKGNDTNSLLLPDGSQIALKAGTELSYRGREVKMIKGEAFFRITKDEQQRFSIQVPNATILVLGTSFNVKTTDSYSDVAVWDGKVSVTGKEGQPVTLTAGNLAIVDNNHGTIKKPGGNYAWRCGWGNHDLSFSDQEVALVMQTVAAYYHVNLKVTDTDILKSKITVRFNNVPLSEALLVLSEMLDLTTIKTADTAYIFQHK
jgi:ferric-dicitrate binding protein FerR (iron transport regulator)